MMLAVSWYSFPGRGLSYCVLSLSTKAHEHLRWWAWSNMGQAIYLRQSPKPAVSRRARGLIAREMPPKPTYFFAKKLIQLEALFVLFYYVLQLSVLSSSIIYSTTTVLLYYHTVVYSVRCCTINSHLGIMHARVVRCLPLPCGGARKAVRHRRPFRTASNYHRSLRNAYMPHKNVLVIDRLSARALWAHSCVFSVFLGGV